MTFTCKDGDDEGSKVRGHVCLSVGPGPQEAFGRKSRVSGVEGMGV